MLNAKISVTAFSAWSFSVVIATKSDRTPGLFVDCRPLNMVTKANRLSLPKKEQMFGGLRRGKYLTTLLLFLNSGR